MKINYLKESSFEIDKSMYYKGEVYKICGVKPSDTTFDTIVYIERIRPIPKEPITNSINDLEI
jgi:glutaminase